jgi:hypothetical protein
MADRHPLKLPQLLDRPGWTEQSELDPATGAFRQKYFFRGMPAQRIPITSKRARQLAGYTLIERYLRAVRGWLETISELSKSQLADENQEGWYLTTKPDPEHSLTSALFIAAVTCYGKCFTTAEGRNLKLEPKTVVPSELLEMHDEVIKFRNNFTAHSGAIKYEIAQVVLVLNPIIRDRIGSKFLLRESLQPEAYIRYDSIESFSTSVERVREHILEKTAQLNQQIFAEEINPKGLDYWYSQNKY